MTRVKICGCRTAADAVAAAEAGADFIGVLFAPGSRRRVTAAEASLITAAVGPPLREMEQESPWARGEGAGAEAAGGVEAWFRHGASALERLLERKRPLVVGVFEDQAIEDVNAIVEESGVDLVQLSGSEAWAEALLASRMVIKAVREGGADEVLAAAEPGGAVALMLDASRGRGLRGDWAVAASMAARVPLWLAGGLTPGDVGEAIAAVRPWLVDVSSGVETDGVKDAAKMRAFVAAVRGA